MRDIFGCFDRTQKPVSKSKDWIAKALIQDLKSCFVSGRCLFEQPFVCYLIRQSKRSIL